MNVSLTPDLERMIQLKVRTGGYASESDVVGEALRLMDERDQAWAFLADEIRGRIAAGVASLRAGEGVDGDAFFAAIDAELAEIEASTAA